MIEIEKPRIECIEGPGDEAYGKFIVEPLERGYGTTLGNSLRRVLLSSLPGTAVTRIKIAGIQHEFSTIPGITEDVTEIVLNVRASSPVSTGRRPKRSISRPPARVKSPPATSRPTARWRSSIPSTISPLLAPTRLSPWS